ncbi:hypothetical protein Q1695_000284 [Nippostrongylus brasiliensis]|nr:hypothetical protein Q1695_000284 [Nippostrongylus brasiliensis]
MVRLYIFDKNHDFGQFYQKFYTACNIRRQPCPMIQYPGDSRRHIGRVEGRLYSPLILTGNELSSPLCRCRRFEPDVRYPRCLQSEESDG